MDTCWLERTKLSPDQDGAKSNSCEVYFDESFSIHHHKLVEKLSSKLISIHIVKTIWSCEVIAPVNDHKKKLWSDYFHFSWPAPSASLFWAWCSLISQFEILCDPSDMFGYEFWLSGSQFTNHCNPVSRHSITVVNHCWAPPNVLLAWSSLRHSYELLIWKLLKTASFTHHDF